MPRLLAYARCVDKEKSVAEQVAMFSDLAPSMGLDWDPVRHVFSDEGRWAVHVSMERPGLVALREHVQEGDCLVVWRASCLDREPMRLAEWLLWLQERGVSLHIVECLGRKPLYLGSENIGAVALGVGVAGQAMKEERARRSVSASQAHDETGMNNLREARRRHLEGERWESIAKDFRQRGLHYAGRRGWSATTLRERVQRLEESMETGEVV